MSIYNPKGIDCILCGVPDCEHFEIPEDGTPISTAYRSFVERGFQPFVYSPYIPLAVISSGHVEQKDSNLPCEGRAEGGKCQEGSPVCPMQGNGTGREEK